MPVEDKAVINGRLAHVCPLTMARAGATRKAPREWPLPLPLQQVALWRPLPHCGAAPPGHARPAQRHLASAHHHDDYKGGTEGQPGE